MYKIVDVNDFVCLRHKQNNDVIDDYVMVTNNESPEIDRVGVYTIKQVSEDSEIGKKIIGKKVGSTFNVKGIQVKITGIYDENDLLQETVKFFKELEMTTEAQDYAAKLKQKKHKRQGKKRR